MSGFCYMLRCADGSYYVGSTSGPLEVRVGEHNGARFGGYTARRRPVTLVWAEEFGDIRDAHAAERRIKGWSRAKKAALAQGDWAAVSWRAKRPGARHGSRPAARAPRHDADSGPERSEAKA